MQGFLEMADIMAKELLTLQIEVSRETIEWDFGKELLSVFLEHDPRLNPQTLHVWHDKVSDFHSLEDAKQHWAGIAQMRSHGSMREFHVGLEWKRRLTTRYQAEIRHESRDIRGHLRPATLSFYAKPHKQIDWKDFAERLYDLTEARYGFLHIKRDAHMQSDLSTAREPTWIVAERTKNSVPNLGWFTFIGNEYCDFFEVEKLERAGAKTRRFDHGIAITLSGNAMDVCNDFESFDSKRSFVKRTFGDGFFSK
ncbi:MAG: hypothetical protein AAGF53_13925 [Pseudomonadota bacterium]